ncbi:homeobox-domain-containing protein [Artomyces pyxidatus]|uniref:Homeobox-domain-containing protein n=1 Tax=Artomyces pyxidatus TaxID=48021 RepID=A0ACB8T4B7_9AGAM|nr:homeobox-domain-containing protein [Artomyces pyxidatus]
MSHNYDISRQSRRSTPIDPHSGSSLHGQGRPRLPPLTSLDFRPTTHPPVSSNAQYYSQPRQSQLAYDTSGYSHSQYNTQYTAPAQPQQQHQQQAYATYAHQQQPDPRYAAGQQAYTYSSHASRTSPPLVQDPRRLPPLSVPQQQPARHDAYSQSAQYYAQSHMDTQMMSATSDVRSPHATYPSAYAQQYQAMPGQYATTHSPPRGVPHAGPPGQHYPQMGVSHASVERTAPIRTPVQLPYARAAPVMSPVDAYDAPDSAESTIKKKRKRADARQLEVLNNTYNRTAFPSTEERAALAKELDMSARSVQIWFQNKRQSMRSTGRANAPAANTSSISQPFNSEPSPAPSSLGHYPGMASVVSPASTAGPSRSSYSSRSPPPNVPMGRTGQSPSPPGGRDRADAESRKQWYSGRGGY